MARLRAPLAFEFFLLSLTAFLAAALDFVFAAGPRGDAVAFAFAWLAILSCCFAVLLALRILIRKLPSAFIFVAALFPVLFVLADEVCHAQRWAHMALGQGGLPHLWRVALIALLPCIVWRVALSPVVRRVGDRAQRPVAIAMTLLAFVSIAGVAYLLTPREAARDERAASGPNVLLLSIDTLRQDVVSAYGGAHTPLLDPLLQTGAVFDGFSPAPWTMPSMAALFSGVGGLGFTEQPLASVPPSLSWWPERLQEQGYRSAAFVSNPHLGDQFGFARGFDSFDHADELEGLAPLAGSILQRWLTRQIHGRGANSRGDHLVAKAAAWLDKTPDDARPWFLWVHLLDPHLPYHWRDEGSFPGASALGDHFDGRAFTDLPAVRSGLVANDVEAQEALRSLYESEVRYADARARRMLDAAQAASGDRGLVWVIASDHGEEFFEHGGFEHGHSLYAELLRVPLIFGGAGILASPDAGALRLQDIGPTLLSHLGVDWAWQPEGVMQVDPPLANYVTGVDASARLAGGSEAPCAPALVASGMRYGPARHRIFHADGASTLIEDEGEALRIGSICSDRYDGSLLAVATLDSMTAQVMGDYQSWRDAWWIGAESEHVDEALLERLRALGYVE